MNRRRTRNSGGRQRQNGENNIQRQDRPDHDWPVVLAAKCSDNLLHVATFDSGELWLLSAFLFHFAIADLPLSVSYSLM